MTWEELIILTVKKGYRKKNGYVKCIDYYFRSTDKNNNDEFSIFNTEDQTITYTKAFWSNQKTKKQLFKNKKLQLNQQLN